MSKKIAVLITDEFEDSEFTSPADEFRKAGHEVITIEKQAGKTVKGKPVFAICHGPQLLISADVIRGRKLTAVKPIIIDVKNAGAEFYDQEVVVDKDQLVTSRTPDDLPAFNREALRLLGA